MVRHTLTQEKVDELLETCEHKATFVERGQVLAHWVCDISDYKSKAAEINYQLRERSKNGIWGYILCRACARNMGFLW